MSPWIPGFQPLDREAWKVFPANTMFALYVIVPLSINLYYGLPWCVLKILALSL
jgi:hypothetical protein